MKRTNKFARNSGITIQTKDPYKKDLHPLTRSLYASSHVDTEKNYFHRAMAFFTEYQFISINNFDLFYQFSSVDFSLYNIPRWYLDLLLIEYSYTREEATLNFDISHLSLEDSFQLLISEEPLFARISNKYKILCTVKDKRSAFDSIYYDDFIDVLRDTMESINNIPEIQSYLQKFSKCLEQDIREYYKANTNSLAIPFWDQKQEEDFF